MKKKHKNIFISQIFSLYWCFLLWLILMIIQHWSFLFFFFRHQLKFQGNNLRLVQHVHIIRRLL
jgi:hypothetical protein